MDCDDVMLLVAGDAQRTLTEVEGARLQHHLTDCEGCRLLISETAPDRPSTGRLEAPDSLPPGARIGRFLVISPLGAGGMGTVFAAYDPDLDRKVAIKLLRSSAWGGSSPTGSERLVREARAMAKLSHENVLTVHEVGTVGDQVFIAMEFAAGGTLREWLAKEHRSWRQIVERFIQAGCGLAAAHRAGLVHRDFKPDNVVLTEDGRVRVADFGLVSVKGTALEPSGDALIPPDAAIDGSLTLTGTLLGTPAYMAPEQHRREAADERTDQFAFCVALYEALYGRRPFQGTSYLQLALDVSERRPSDPPAGSAVPRWLHAVVTRGLEADPHQRFPSMDALLAELRTDPEAVRRRRLRTAGAVAGLVAVAAAAAITARAGRAGEDPCEPAEDRLAGVWDDVQRRAVKEAFLAGERPHAADVHARVSARLDDYASSWTVARVDSCQATHVRGEQSGAVLDLRMRCLDRRRSELAALVTVFVGEPSTEVLDHAVQAAEQLIPISACADVESLAAATPPPEDPIVREQVEDARARLDRARALERAGEYRDGLAAATEIAEQADALGYAPLQAEAVALVARLLEANGKLADSEAAHRRTLKAAAEARDDALVAETWRHLIDGIGVQQARHEEALALRVVAEAALIRAGGDRRLDADLSHSLGALSWVRGESVEAEGHFQRALAIREEHFGPEHLSVAAAHNGLGPVLRALGEYDRARGHYERALAIYERVLGPAHPEVARPLDNLGVVLNAKGAHEQAESFHRRALAIKVAALGPDHPRLANTLNNLGLVFKARGRYQEAREHYERALAIYEASLGPAHPRLASVLNNLGFVLQQEGRHDEARARYERALVIDREALGPEHVYVANSLHNLGLVLTAQGRRQEAEDHFERALSIKERALGPEHPSVANTLHSVGRVLEARGRATEAERRYRRALQIWEAAVGPSHPSTAFALTSLGHLLIEQRRTAEAISLLERALAIRESHGAAAELIAETQAGLARALSRSGRDLVRARELAARARDTYAAGSADAKALAELDAMLRQRRHR